MTAAGRVPTKPTPQRFEALSVALSVRGVTRDTQIGSRAVRPTCSSLTGQVAQANGDLSFGKVSKRVGAVDEETIRHAVDIQTQAKSVVNKTAKRLS